MTPTEILIELFRTLDDALFAEHHQNGHRAGQDDRLLGYDELWHALCHNPDRCRLNFRPIRWPGEQCVSPYAELVRLTRRPGPMHATIPQERWHVLQRHRYCDRRPATIHYRNGKPISIGTAPHIHKLTLNQAVLNDDGKPRKATRSTDTQTVILETWAPIVQPTLVTAGLEWLADNYRVPVQLPREIRKAVAA